MIKSESITNIAKALQVFHLKMGKIKKDGNNPFFKSKYATLTNILDNIAEPLTEAGLIFTQFPDGENGLTTLLLHPESGEFLEATGNMHPKDNDPQALGSAITYNRRYHLGAILGLNIEEDDDGNAATKPNKYVNKDERPWLSEAQFRQAHERIMAGETDLLKEVDSKYRMKKEYRQTLTEAAS